MKNEFGLDADYFREKLARILESVSHYKPDEMARELARLVVVADENVLGEREFSRPAPVQVPSGWKLVRDGDAIIVSKAGIGGCVVRRDATEAREIPETILWEIADDMLAAAPSAPVAVAQQYDALAAYDAGFRRACDWARRDDMLHDLESFAYKQDRASDIERLGMAWEDNKPAAPSAPAAPSVDAEKVMALDDEQHRAVKEATDLLEAIADYERKNGTVSHLVDANEVTEVAAIVSEWAMSAAARRSGPVLRALLTPAIANQEAQDGR